MPVIDRRGKPLPKNHPFKLVRIILGMERPTIQQDLIKQAGDIVDEPMDELTREIVDAWMNSRRPMNEVLTEELLNDIIAGLQQVPTSDSPEGRE